MNGLDEVDNQESESNMVKGKEKKIKLEVEEGKDKVESKILEEESKEEKKEWKRGGN